MTIAIVIRINDGLVLATDSASAITESKNETSRFVPGPQIIGGPTDIAIITPHEGFSWIKRKHYNVR